MLFVRNEIVYNLPTPAFNKKVYAHKLILLQKPPTPAFNKRIYAHKLILQKTTDNFQC